MQRCHICKYVFRLPHNHHGGCHTAVILYGVCELSSLVSNTSFNSLFLVLVQLSCRTLGRGRVRLFLNTDAGNRFCVEMGVNVQFGHIAVWLESEVGVIASRIQLICRGHLLPSMETPATYGMTIAGETVVHVVWQVTIAQSAANILSHGARVDCRIPCSSVGRCSGLWYWHTAMIGAVTVSDEFVRPCAPVSTRTCPRRSFYATSGVVWLGAGRPGTRLLTTSRSQPMEN